MAGVLLTASTAEVALSAATAKTILQVVAASNHRVKVLGWGVYFDGVSPTEAPVVVDLQRQTSAGTMTSLTPTKNNDSDDETLQTTAQHTATSEPSSGDSLKKIEVHPQTGYEWIAPFGQEVIIKGGGRLGIKCTAPAACNAIGYMLLDE